MGVRAKDPGESERRSLIERMGFRSDPIFFGPKGANFRLVSLCKRTCGTTVRESRQMAVMKMTGATSDGEVDWHSVNWAVAHQTVRRLQMRIAKATREKRWGKVKTAMAFDPLVLRKSYRRETCY